MPQGSRSINHPSDRQREVSRELRRKITSGVYPPGHRIPTRRELSERHATSMPTIQKALSRLEKAGFIRSCGRAGSFVADYPPHLHRYGLVFYDPPVDSNQVYWSKWFTTMAQVVGNAEWFSPDRFAIYSGINSFEKSEDLHRLEADVLNDRLAGLVFTLPFLANEQLIKRILKRRSVPVVSIAGPTEMDRLSGVEIDTHQPQKALDWLGRQGCRKISILLPQFTDQSRVAQIRQFIHERGMTTGPGWIMGHDPHHTRWAFDWISLLMSLPADQRPDGLFITDDNFIEEVNAGLANAGVVAGRDLRVITHVNRPLVTPVPPGFASVGVDVREAIRQCLKIIQLIRVNPEFRQIIPLEVILEDPSAIVGPR